MKANIVIEDKTFQEFPQMVRNDFGQNINFEVKLNDNLAYNLSGMTVKFKSQRYNDSTSKIDATCTITNFTSGLCTYTIQDTDLDVIGKFSTELELSTTTMTISTKLGDLIVVDNI